VKRTWTHCAGRSHGFLELSFEMLTLSCWMPSFGGTDAGATPSDPGSRSVRNRAFLHGSGVRFTGKRRFSTGAQSGP